MRVAWVGEEILVSLIVVHELAFGQRVLYPDSNHEANDDTTVSAAIFSRLERLPEFVPTIAIRANLPQVPTTVFVVVQWTVVIVEQMEMALLGLVIR